MSRTPPRRLRPGAVVLTSVLAAFALGAFALAPRGARAEEPLTPEQIRERSLPLRTALHHDPTLGSPFDRLLAMYRKADRVEELLAVYRSHLQQYPQDGSARIVHVRLLLATSDPAAPQSVRDAVEQHPDNAYLHYLLYTLLQDRGDPRALDALDRAIERETLPARKRRWVDMLLAQALQQDRRELAARHMAALATLLGGTAEAHLKAARTMDRFGQHEAALEALEKARGVGPSPEMGVDIELLAAKLELALGRRDAAAARLDTLLGRLTADYWRRGDILRRRARLVASSDERDRMLAEARARVDAHPQDESAALDCARLLAGFERHREALEVLASAGERLPASTRIEKEVLVTYDRLRDEHGRLRYLEARLERRPDRQDLVERRIRSLFLVGRRAKALEALDALLAPLPEAVRIQRLLESARFLRTAGLHTTAADLYERIVALAPGRLDVRREWAECHLADGDRVGARRVLAAPIPTDAPRDVFLDLMQLLTSQRMHAEARGALQARTRAHPDDLDVLLALIEVEGRLGYAASGARLIDTARARADTPARYRRWLERAVEFHFQYDHEQAFLDEEQERLLAATGPWNERRLGRIDAFADACAEHDRIEPVAILLQGWLEGGLPEDAQIRLRRKLAAMLEESGRGWFTRNEAHLGAAAEELRGLIREDTEHADLYRARLALLHLGRRRADLARPLLEQVNVRRIGDPRMLDRLVRAYTELDDGAQVLAALERLTGVASAERGAWEDWLEALLASGDEHGLRSAIRRLLRGVPRLALAQDTKHELEAHLADSYWRSIGAELGVGSEAGDLEALALLDEAERIGAAEDLPRWVAWTRAWILHRRGRTAARDEALAELDRMIGERIERVTTAFDRELAQAQVAGEAREAVDIERERAARIAEVERIDFPDGLCVRWQAARALLDAAEAPGATQGGLRDRRGPGGHLRVRWAFETEGAVPVIAVLPLDADTLLVADLAGDLHGIDRATGKLRWHRPAAYATRGAGGAPNQAHLAPLRLPVVGPGGTFYLPMAGGVLCHGPDGALRWEASLGPQGQRAPLALAADEAGVYAYDTASGQVACFHHEHGKLRWLRTLDMKPQSVPAAQGEGISLDAGRLLVYGPRTAILEARTGDVLWSFEPDRARRMPVRLLEPDDEVRGLFGRRTPRASAPRTTAAAPTPAFTGSPPGTPGGVQPQSAQVIWSSAAPGAPPPTVGLGGRRSTLPPGVVYRTTPGRSPHAWSPRTAPGASSAVVAPAVAWAAPLGAAESRFGLLAGRRLLLARGTAMPQGGHHGARALLLDTDVPMLARTMPIEGTPVALDGHRLALLHDGALVVWHLGRGSQARFDLAPLADGRASFRVHAVQAGGFVYLAGPGGVLCVHLPTLEAVWRAPWPAAARDAAAGEEPSSLLYTLRGMTAYHGTRGWSPMIPSVGMVDDDALYTLAGPTRLVALEDAEEADDGR